MEQESGKSPIWKDIHILETLRGGGIFFIVKILGSLGAYLFAWYVSKKYGAEGNGILAFTLTLAVLLGAVFNLGLNTYAVKIISNFRAEDNLPKIHVFLRKTLVVVSQVTIVGSILILILSYLIPYGDLSRELFLVGFMVIPVSLLLLLSHVFKARKMILGFSLLQNNIIQVLALIILVLPMWGRLEPVEPVWAFIIAGMIMGLIGMFTINRIFISQPLSDSKSFNFHLRESFPMLAGGLAFMILNLTDRLMLRFLDTTEQLGIYDVALRLSNLTLLGILALNSIAEPKFAELYAQNDSKSLRRFVNRTTWMGIVISIPVIVVLGLFPDIWMGLFGHNDEFLRGTGSLYILLVGQAWSVGCGAVLILLNMTGHQRNVQNILIIAALLNVMLNALLIPRLGIAGAALATLFSTIVWNGCGVWMVKKKLGFWMWI